MRSGHAIRGRAPGIYQLEISLTTNMTNSSSHGGWMTTRRGGIRKGKSVPLNRYMYVPHMFHLEECYECILSINHCNSMHGERSIALCCAAQVVKVGLEPDKDQTSRLSFVFVQVISPWSCRVRHEADLCSCSRLREFAVE